MNIIGAKEISLGVDKILGCDSEVCDFMTRLYMSIQVRSPWILMNC